MSLQGSQRKQASLTQFQTCHSAAQPHTSGLNPPPGATPDDVKAMNGDGTLPVIGVTSVMAEKSALYVTATVPEVCTVTLSLEPGRKGTRMPQLTKSVETQSRVATAPARVPWNTS